MSSSNQERKHEHRGEADQGRGRVLQGSGTSGRVGTEGCSSGGGRGARIATGDCSRLGSRARVDGRARTRGLVGETDGESASTFLTGGAAESPVCKIDEPFVNIDMK
jgi:hypothetical protein